MTEFKVGDRVRVEGTDTEFDGLTGTFEGEIPGRKHPLNVLLTGAGVRYFSPGELVRLSPRFVNVVDNPSIWVTLPGDNAGHKLTTAEAKQLLRELEEVV